MKSRARDEVGVGNPKLHIGKPQFFAIFSTRVSSSAPACHADALKRWQVAGLVAINFGEEAQWPKVEHSDVPCRQGGESAARFRVSCESITRAHARKGSCRSCLLATDIICRSRIPDIACKCMHH